MRKTILLTAMLLAVVSSIQAANLLTVTTNPETVTKGSVFELIISMENEIEVSAYDFHLYLPVGIALVYDEEAEDYLYELSDRHNKKHQLTIKYDETDDSFMLGVSDPSLHKLTGNSGEIIRLKLMISDDAIPGVYDGGIKKIWFAESGNSGVEVEDVAFGISTGIHDVLESDNTLQYYNLNGQRVVKLTKGVYVTKGKKIVKE